jgi:ribosomal protein L21E
MSIRETIANNIVETLQAVNDLQPGFVTREPFDVEKLAITQFPAILLESGEELRSTTTMGAGRRQSTITYILRTFARGNELDTKRNNLIETIEEALDHDRYRGLSGTVLDTQIVRIEVIPRLQPLAEVLVEVAVTYVFTRGQA